MCIVLIEHLSMCWVLNTFKGDHETVLQLGPWSLREFMSFVQLSRWKDQWAMTRSLTYFLVPRRLRHGFFLYLLHLHYTRLPGRSCAIRFSSIYPGSTLFGSQTSWGLRIVCDVPLLLPLSNDDDLCLFIPHVSPKSFIIPVPSSFPLGWVTSLCGIFSSVNMP